MRQSNMHNTIPIKTIDEPCKQQKGKEIVVATMNCMPVYL